MSHLCVCDCLFSFFFWFFLFFGNRKHMCTYNCLWNIVWYVDGNVSFEIHIWPKQIFNCMCAFLTRVKFCCYFHKREKKKRRKKLFEKKVQREIWIIRVNYSAIHISKTGTSIPARKISSFSKTEEKKLAIGLKVTKLCEDETLTSLFVTNHFRWFTWFRWPFHFWTQPNITAATTNYTNTN